jgi:WD40 repeat protein
LPAPDPGVRSFTAHADGISLLLFSPDSRRLLTASSKNTFQARAGKMVPGSGSDTTLLLWDVETAQQLQRFEGHADGITSAAFLPDGRRFLSGSLDRTIRLWDVTTGQELQKWSTATAPVTALAATPDGRRAVSGGRDGAVSVWEVPTGKELSRYLGPRSITLVAPSPDGRYAAAIDVAPALYLWDAVTGKGLHRLTLPSPELVPARDGIQIAAGLQLAFTAGGTEVLALYRDQRYGIRLQRWQMVTGTLTRGGPVKDSPAWPWATETTALAPDHRRVLLGGGTINGRMAVTLIDTTTAKLVHRFEVRHCTGLGPWPLAALSPDGRLAAMTQSVPEVANGYVYLRNNLVRLYRLPE